MSKVKGSCLCGKVSFKCDDQFNHFHLCHCSQCQKATGSAHEANLFTNPENIEWLSGTNLVKRYDVLGRTISNAFCEMCGSGLPYVSSSGKSLVVPAGRLDSFPDIEPQDNIFISEKATWYDAAITTKKYSKFPE